MADLGRISAVIPEVVADVPAGDAKGRVSAVIPEVVGTMPAGDAKGRVSAVIAEVVATTPVGDARGRVSAVIPEVVANEVQSEVRVATIVVEVFCKAPTGTAPVRHGLGGNIQGGLISSFRLKK